ncbi:MAG: hypothetical protein IMZ62_14825 [Chloroflexi bacterium]|nr:hypothetical protein [Chloroflexota bacterium]
MIKAAIRAISAVKRGGPFEDSYVEFKAQFPKPEKAPRWMAAMANAARRDEIIVIIGVDEHGKVWGADNVELASWYPKVEKQFDGPAPRMITNVNVPIDEETVTALCFGCLDAPYMIRAGETRDIPWREGNRTRCATREELFGLFSEAEVGVKLPTVDVVDKGFRPEYDSAGNVSRIMLHVRLYVKTKGLTPLVFPRHDCRVSVIKGRRRFKFDDVWLMRSKTEGGEVQADIVYDKPGELYLIAFGESPSSFPDGPVTVEICLLPVGAPAPVKLTFRMNMDFPKPPPRSKPDKGRRNPWIPTPLEVP